MCSDEVRTLLQKLQDAYARRDQGLLDDTLGLFTDSVDARIIGTNALGPGQGEWCTSREMIRELLSGDWEHWGDVRFDVAGALISCFGDVAWMATTATVADTITDEWRYDGYVGWAKDLLDEEETSSRDKLLQSVRLGVELLVGLQEGEHCIWPFRLTAVAVREDETWRFAQMHFSFPTTLSPDVRLQ